MPRVAIQGKINVFFFSKYFRTKFTSSCRGLMLSRVDSMSCLLCNMTQTVTYMDFMFSKHCLHCRDVNIVYIALPYKPSYMHDMTFAQHPLPWDRQLSDCQMNKHAVPYTWINGPR